MGRLKKNMTAEDMIKQATQAQSTEDIVEKKKINRGVNNGKRGRPRMYPVVERRDTPGRPVGVTKYGAGKLIRKTYRVSNKLDSWFKTNKEMLEVVVNVLGDEYITDDILTKGKQLKVLLDDIVVRGLASQRLRLSQEDKIKQLLQKSA